MIVLGTAEDAEPIGNPPIGQVAAVEFGEELADPGEFQMRRQLQQEPLLAAWLGYFFSASSSSVPMQLSRIQTAFSRTIGTDDFLANSCN